MPRKISPKYEYAKILVLETRHKPDAIGKEYRLRCWSSRGEGKAEVTSFIERKDAHHFPWAAVSAAVRWARHLIRTDRAERAEVFFRAENADSKADILFAYVIPREESEESIALQAHDAQKAT